MLRAVQLKNSLMQRRYSDATAGCSMAAEHLLTILLDLRRAGEDLVPEMSLFLNVNRWGYGWSEEQFQGYLDELRRNNCIEVVEILDQTRDVAA